MDLVEMIAGKLVIGEKFTNLPLLFPTEIALQSP